MIGQKTQMVTAVITAILLAILLAGLSYFLVPEPSNQAPLPMPVPSVLNQIFVAILWIGLAALIAITTVAVVLLINRRITKKNNLE
jgi:heme/copper-type cytochrome/quinol oxidase subunit 4